MIQGLLGTKLRMSRMVDGSCAVVGATLVSAGPCYVTQIKTVENDGYAAVQIGYQDSEKLNKPQLGHLRGIAKVKHLREVKVEEGAELTGGQKFDASLFDVGEIVDVTAT